MENEMTRIVQAYGQSILRLAYVYLKNHADAEDIAQEVFVTYISKMPYCETEAHKKAWLMKVTSNKCKNLLKSAWKKRTVEMNEELSYMSPENSGVLQYVFSLDEKYKIPIHLYYYEGYSINEIARHMNKKPATVGTWLSRGRALLKSILREDYYE